MTLVEIRRNFPWMGEQNYLELKHSRSINNSVLGRKTLRSLTQVVRALGLYLSQTRYLLQNGDVQYEEEIASFVALGPSGRRKCCQLINQFLFLSPRSPASHIHFPHRLHFQICASFTLWDHREFQWGGDQVRNRFSMITQLLPLIHYGMLRW